MTVLSIIIPTYNESDNIKNLIERLSQALKPSGIDAEILVVDDNSPDNTADIAESLSFIFPIRVIKREGQRGLGPSIIEGINAARSPVICVMDADLSHPPEAVPSMFKAIQQGKAQLVIGSRRVGGGGTSEWIWYRKVISWVATSLGSFLTPVKDLTSGFFMFDKKVIDGVELTPRSWKIGLEIMVKGKYAKCLEYPITFIEREAGTSKMSGKEVLAYISHLMHLSLYKLFHGRER